MSDTYDFAVIGAGMAGASIAAELAPHARVVVLEAEDQPAYHATGRSAAFWVQTYGGPGVQPLTTASGPWLAERGFLKDRGGLSIARADQQGLVDDMLQDFAASGVAIETIGRSALEERLSGLLPEWVVGVWEPDCKDIDVAAVFAHCLAAARKAGAEVRTRARVASLERDGNWLVRTEAGEEFRARNIVNAAGAWADPVAALAGVRPIGIQPFRRTIAQLVTSPEPPDDLPLVVDIAGEFYFKPESGRLWLSPHDETPSEPCDAAAEEYDVAVAIDRLQHVVDWKIERVEHRWAGLRSFAPDRLPVYGPDPREPSFIWFAGQGGFGIQTAPAAARLAAQRILGREPDAMTAGIDASLYDPARFVQSA